MTEPSERADTTITLDFADAAKARDAFDRIEVWVREVGIANDCTLAMSTAPAEPSDAEVEAAARAIVLSAEQNAGRCWEHLTQMANMLWGRFTNEPERRSSRRQR